VLVGTSRLLKSTAGSYVGRSATSPPPLPPKTVVYNNENLNTVTRRLHLAGLSGPIANGAK
jgi:hypothetical protein